MELTPKLSLGDSPLWNLDLTLVWMTLITGAIVFLITFIASRNLSLVPGRLQNLVETIIEFTRGIVRANLDKKTSERFYGFAFTLFLFIFVANQLGLMFSFVVTPKEDVHTKVVQEEQVVKDEEEHHGYALWKSPTADINVPIALAFAITIMAHLMGIKRSARKYFSHYFQPFKPMVVLHIIDEIAKPVTHGLRLWANIFAGEVLIMIMLKASPLLTGAPLVVWLGYSVFVGTIQAYVFTVLAMVYLAQKISHS